MSSVVKDVSSMASLKLMRILLTGTFEKPPGLREMTRGPLVSGGGVPVSAAAALSLPPLTVMPSRASTGSTVARIWEMTWL